MSASTCYAGEIPSDVFYFLYFKILFSCPTFSAIWVNKFWKKSLYIFRWFFSLSFLGLFFSLILKCDHDFGVNKNAFLYNFIFKIEGHLNSKLAVILISLYNILILLLSMSNVSSIRCATLSYLVLFVE